MPSWRIKRSTLSDTSAFGAQLAMNAGAAVRPPACLVRGFDLDDQLRVGLRSRSLWTTSPSIVAAARDPERFALNPDRPLRLLRVDACERHVFSLAKKA